MPKKYENVREYDTSWYALTANRLLMTLGPLKGEVNCDVCVVGGGFTGISAALELSQTGLSVVLLEARELSSSAPGRNGGHLLRGLGRAPGALISRFGLAEAKFLCNVTLEGMALIIERITRHDIKCDLTFGHLSAAAGSLQAARLHRDRDDWEKLGHADMAWVKKARAEEMTGTDRYIGGLFDPKGAHFHPLNYVLGIAQEAQKAGCKIHDQTPATEIAFSPSPRVETPNGTVRAKFIILAGAVGTKGAARIKRASIPATAYMISTQALDAEGAEGILPGGIAVTEAGAVPGYYRLSPDRRMLFGANRNGRPEDGMDKELRQRMTTLFPALKTARIEHAWHSPLDFTFNRLPHVGRLAPNVYFAHGFGGHGQGIIAANILGKILAEAVGGTAARFDVFARIGHFPLGPLKRPLSALGQMWERIRDVL